MSQSTSERVSRSFSQALRQLFKPLVGHRHGEAGVCIKFGAAAENLSLRPHADFIIFPRLHDLIFMLVEPLRKAAACVAWEMQHLIFKLLDAHGSEIRLRGFLEQTKRP